MVGNANSGRRPSEETIIKRLSEPQTPVGNIGVAGNLYLPNYSGLKEGLKKTDSNDIYLKLNQSTAQTITASPIFNWGTYTRIPFYDANKKLTDSSSLTFDNTNKYLTLTGASGKPSTIRFFDSTGGSNLANIYSSYADYSFNIDQKAGADINFFVNNNKNMWIDSSNVNVKNKLYINWANDGIEIDFNSISKNSGDLSIGTNSGHDVIITSGNFNLESYSIHLDAYSGVFSSYLNVMGGFYSDQTAQFNGDVILSADYANVGSPQEGSIAWDFTNHKPVYYDGSAWYYMDGTAV